MAEFVIRLDDSKHKSECRGDRTPDDPHYRVHWWQGQMVGKDMVLLPFDPKGELVPDDGKTEPWQGLNSDGKPVTHFPLYTKAMRDLVEKKKKRAASILTKPEEEEEFDDQEDASGALEEVNFGSWLRGETNYDWTLLQAAGKKRYSRMWTSKKQMVQDLVLDEKVVPEEQVCSALAKNLPQAQAA